MKRLLLLLGCCGGLLCAADLTDIHSVYVMPMSRGLDQYLANRLSNGPFQVVTDPKLADAIFTDTIGENFQTQLENIFPTPKPEPVKAAVPEKTTAPEKTPAPEKATTPEKTTAPEKATPPAKKADAAPTLPEAEAPARHARSADTQTPGNPMLGDTVNRLEIPPSSFGRARGTIFLVGAKSRQVVWSTFDPSKSTHNRDLDRTASDIVSRLKKALKAALK